MSKTNKTEIWKSLDFLGYPNYEVSNFGRVKSLHFGKERLLKPIKNNKGYLFVHLSKDNKIKHFLAHRLVATTFIPNPENLPIVNHKDENPLNNSVENLEFCTVQYNNTYNNAHLKRGEKMKGENNPMYGKHLSEEHKQKISKVMSGKPKSEETKQKISIVKKGKPNYKHRKPILQFTLDNVFVQEWDSATSASKELNIIQGSITQCCKNKRKSAGGYVWRYKE